MREKKKKLYDDDADENVTCKRYFIKRFYIWQTQWKLVVVYVCVCVWTVQVVVPWSYQMEKEWSEKEANKSRTKFSTERRTPKHQKIKARQILYVSCVNTFGNFSL